jgi:hypothetical protein
LTSPLIQGVRDALREREALLIHFNTVMSRHEKGYPHDLHDAWNNPGWKMCYSTIRSGDLGPTQMIPDHSRAGGCVGIVVDMLRDTSIHKVSYTDVGSNGRVHVNGLGELASVDSCCRSIDDRGSEHNEWLVEGAIPLGIFVFNDPAVTTACDVFFSVSVDSVIREFANFRIFSSHSGGFREFDRTAQEWVHRSYSEIVSP